MLSLLARIWQTVKNFLQQFFSSLDNPSAQDRKDVPKPYRPLSDEDYEYLWTQLLEGVAYGWQPGRIQRFFETLGDRGHKDSWLAWLERYEAKVLANPTPNRTLAKRLIKLGEQTQALPNQSSAWRVGNIAERLGKALLSQKTAQPSAIWEYDGPDTGQSEETPPPETVEAVVPPVETVATPEAEPGTDLPREAAETQPHLMAENAPDPEAWFNRGVQCYEQEAYVQAISYWDKAIELKPDYYQAWSNRGLALKNLSRWTEALENYQKALEIEDKYSKAWYNQGIALEFLERYEEAIASFDRVLALDPEDFRAWYSRGNTLQRCGRYEEAIASYNCALERQQELERAWYERGNAYCQLNNPQAAIASYDKAIALKTDDPEIWYSRGQALVEAQKLEEAIASYDRALQLEPTAWHIWLGRSRAVKQSLATDLLLTSLSPVAQKHPELNQRGETGEVACLEVGLHYLLPDTHPEGWGRLHWRIGQIQYSQGAQVSHPFELWRNATSRYQEALKAIAPASFPDLYLAILQDLIEVQIGLEESELATQLYQRGLQQFHNFQVDPQRSAAQKRQLEQQFKQFQLLGVAISIQAGELTQALERAAKNATWAQLQNQLEPSTAIVYWHQSSVALTTFLVLPEAAEPLVLDRPANVVVSVVLTPLVRAKIRAAKGDSQQLSAYLLELLHLTGDSPEATQTREPVDRCPPDLQRLHRWQAWQQSWQHFAQQPQEWRRKLPELLNQLAEILDISLILTELDNYYRKIPYSPRKTLKLVPTDEMAGCPLAALFDLAANRDSELTISTFPDADFTSLPIQGKNKPQSVLYWGHLDRDWRSRLEADFATVTTAIPDDAPAAIASLQDADIIHLKNADLVEDELVLETGLHLEIATLNRQTFAQQPLIILDLPQTAAREARSLASILIRQGASCVLSSLWRVDSPAQTLLLLEFYRQLARDTSPEIALRNAQNWLQTATNRDLKQWYQDRDSQAFQSQIEALMASPDKLESPHPPYTHPYYWAGWRVTSLSHERA
jgi:tetratricopeptide (TPR) repeat protein